MESRPGSTTGPKSVRHHANAGEKHESSAVIGLLIVICCLATPVVLSSFAAMSEEAQADSALQGMRQSATVPEAASSAATSRLLSGHYYFINGCVSAPVDCGADGATFGQYYEQLGRMHAAAVAASSAEDQSATFELWAAEHVSFISAETAPDGAYQIEEQIAANKSPGAIHMLGTSAGGAAIITYLSRAMAGEVSLDSRVRSAIAVDSPLGFHFPIRSYDLLLGVEAGLMKSNVALRLGDWAEASDIALLTVNTPNDIVNHEPIPAVPNDAAPIYPAAAPADTQLLPCGSLWCPPDTWLAWLDRKREWHVYTGMHMADSVRRFMEEHWR